MRQRCKPDAQHLVRAQCRHLLFKFVGGIDHVGPHIGDDIVVNMLQVAQLLVEMPRQQQRAVVEFALGDLQRALAELQGEIAGTQHDRHHQSPAAEMISHWIAPSRIPDSTPATDRRKLPAPTLSDELACIFPAPTGAYCTRAQSKRALAKGVIAKLKHQSVFGRSGNRFA